MNALKRSRGAIQGTFDKPNRSAKIIDYDNQTRRVNGSIDNDFKLKYNLQSDVIIKQYSSSITRFDTTSLLRYDNLRNENGWQFDGNRIVLGTSFAGKIEYVPDYVKRLLAKHSKSLKLDEPLQCGDRVWGTLRDMQDFKSDPLFLMKHSKGIAAAMESHVEPKDNAWRDYIAVPFYNLIPAPENIPLHYLGMLSWPTKHFCGNLFQSKIFNFSELRRLRVLLIGSGNDSFLTSAIAVLKAANCQSLTVITTSQRHETVIEKEFGIASENIINYGEKDYMVECDKYDMVIDSLSKTSDDIALHMQALHVGGIYWYTNTDYQEKLYSMPFRQGRKLASQFKRELEHVTDYRSKKSNCIDVYYQQFASPASFFSFSLLMEDFKFPIAIDRMYGLENFDRAMEYLMSNEKHILGENVGLLINKEDDFDPPDEDTVWYPVQLDDISFYKKSYHRRDNTNTIDQDTHIDTEMENEKEIEEVKPI